MHLWQCQFGYTVGVFGYIGTYPFPGRNKTPLQSCSIHFKGWWSVPLQLPFR